MISRRTIALVSVILIMIVWGSTFVVTKTAVREIPPLTLAVLRYLIAVCVLAPVAIVRFRSKHLRKRFPLGRLILMSFTGIAFFTIAFNFALVYGSASQGALIFALVPGAVAIAAVVFLKERVSKRRITGILLSICGVALVVAMGEKSGSSPNPLIGALWMIAAVIGWAAYTVTAKQLADADQIILITYVTAIGMAMLLPLAVVELMRGSWPSLTAQGWFGMLFLGVIASAVAYVVYSTALRELEASLVGVLVNLDPIVGVLIAVLFLGETLNLMQMLGGAIALAGMWLASSQTTTK